jgi:transposase
MMEGGNKERALEKSVGDKPPAKRRQYSAEQKVRIVLARLLGAEAYRWRNEFLEAGKKRLAGNTLGEIPDSAVKALHSEAEQLKQLLGELLLENRLLKKKIIREAEK